MRVDIIDLRDFYSQPLGRVVSRAVSRELRSFWPDVRGLDVAGLGFPLPFLESFRGEAQRVLSLMPAGQGVCRWPGQGGSLTALVDEPHLPLPDASIDRLVLVHSLEMTEAVRPLLREAWRVLAANGRLMVITPNRRGLWAGAESTPFGHGRPFSRGQLTSLMRETMFSPIDWGHALFMPPVALRLMMRWWGAWENLGGRFWPHFSGLLFVEAAKQIYAVTPEPKRARILRPVPATATAPQVARTPRRPIKSSLNPIAGGASMETQDGSEQDR